jgi:hypothetical protein
MIINSTNISKSKSLLIITVIAACQKKNPPRQMTWKTQVHWDRYKNVAELDCLIGSQLSTLASYNLIQGRIQDFKLGGALKKIAPSGGGRENIWGISCEKSRFYAKKSYFPPPGSAPVIICKVY